MPDCSEDNGDLPAPIREVRELACDRARAFRLFTGDFGRWWPAEYTWSQDALRAIAIEPSALGRCFEVGGDGGAKVWGLVVGVEPGEHLAFRWMIHPDRSAASDPARASLVTVRWVDRPDGCSVEIRHEGFARHPEALLRSAIYNNDARDDAIQSRGGGPWSTSTASGWTGTSTRP
jgi:uncharacterized protein YndB with AHSA1/START domain